MEREIDLAALTAGDQDAWDAFVDRFSAVIYGAVRKVILARCAVVDEEDVRDAAQAVFKRLVRHDCRCLRSYDPSRASLVTWLTIIARNVTIDGLRKKNPVVVPLENQATKIAAPRGPQPPVLGIPPNLLSPRQTLIIRLLYEKDMDVREVSEMLAISEQTVRSARHKAIRKLRSIYDRKK